MSIDKHTDRKGSYVTDVMGRSIKLIERTPEDIDAVWTPRAGKHYLAIADAETGEVIGMVHVEHLLSPLATVLEDDR